MSKPGKLPASFQSLISYFFLWMGATGAPVEKLMSILTLSALSVKNLTRVPDTLLRFDRMSTGIHDRFCENSVCLCGCFLPD